MTTLRKNVFRVSAMLAASVVFGAIAPANADDQEARQYVEAMRSVEKQTEVVAAQNSATHQRAQELASDIVDVVARIGDKSTEEILSEFASLLGRAQDLARQSENQSRELDILDRSLKGMMIRAGKYADERPVRNAYESASRASRNTHSAISRTQHDLNTQQEAIRDLVRSIGAG